MNTMDLTYPNILSATVAPPRIYRFVFALTGSDMSITPPFVIALYNSTPSDPPYFI